MHQKHPPTRQSWKTRGLSLILALALVLGLAPGLDLGGGGSAHWADQYLSQLVEWGFIRPDQAQDPAEELTRADFMAITNRAYGYHETGPTPFEDVKVTDWFYDDVGIAYTAKFIKGTSETTASPNDTLTRETAATILGRNMMLEESEGEILDFSDARDISFWSKGVIKSSLEHYLVSGYDDGTFRPQNAVTWGEMAAMVTRIVGTPLQEAGDYALGGVFGNVTISSPGVTLRDTVVSGDLYVTGGVGLGDIKLENVTVLGRIICSGTGEAEGGAASILLRNVSADELLIDNLQGKTVSVQADGITEIGRTTVRTSAYLEDNTPEGMGLKAVTLEGHAPDEDDENAEPVSLTLAGRVEEVVNKTPDSLVHVAKGSVAKLTVDEAATGSHVTIDRNAEVKELNLDTAAIADGEGDIKHLNVNAPGCDVSILPEEITIRPGITAVIDGEEMDTTAAEESNRAPQILSGYPKAEDIAPTTISAVFAANKKGTIHWAISPITDGSVSTEDLLKPPAYGSIAVARGTVAAVKAEEEVRAAVTGLTPGGSYYLSAVMVDDRGVQSPTKVISFSTPDNTVPAFCQGYPHMSTTSAQRGCQVVVMPTKSCNLYYALMPEGAAAPTEAEFKANSVSGNLGFGVVPVTKNTESVIRVDDVTLEEQKNYVLFLWLVDADGTNKSPITSLTFTTDDETPPFFIVSPTVNSVQATSVGLNFRLSENGTVYWAVVPVGTEYPKKQPGHDSINLSDEWAKLQVQNGYSALASGSVAASPERDGTITVGGLQPETAYDLYYLARDTAGNYSVMVQHLTINTLDQTGPKFSQIFTRYSGLDNTVNPMVDTGIIIQVTENIRVNVDGAGEDLVSLYEASTDAAASAVSRKEAKDKLILSLRSSLVLNQVTSGTGRGTRPVPIKGDTGVDDNWVVDYDKVTIERKDGAVVITFPPEALQLDSGSTYYFTVSNVTDTSSAQNPVTPSPIDFYSNAAAGQAGGHDMRLFTIMLGQLYLTRTGLSTSGEESEQPVKPGSWTVNPDGTVTDNKNSPAHADEENLIPVDFSFRMIPQSTSKMDDNMCYDLLFFTDAVIDFDLYYRVVKANADGSTTPVDLSASANSKYQMPNWAARAQNAGTAGWYKLGSSGILRGSASAEAGASMGTQFNGCNQSNFPRLNQLDDSGDVYYEFAVSVTQKDTSRVRGEWSGEVNLSVYGAAAPSTNLSTLTAHPTFKAWDDSTATAAATTSSFLGKGLSNGGGVSIGITDQGLTFLKMAWPFTDNRVPSFSTESGFPKITPGDTFAEISLALDRAGTIDFVVAPRENGINATVINNDPTAAGTTELGKAFSADDLWTDTPQSGLQIQPGVEGSDPKQAPEVVQPEALSIAEHLFPRYIQDRVQYDGNNATIDVSVKGLTPDTDYYIYFVTSGVSTDLSDIYIYKFHTKKSAKPKIKLNAEDSGNVEMTTDLKTTGYYRVLTEQDAETIAFLTSPFDQYSDYPASGTSDVLPDAYAGPGFTVLDAMMKQYSNYEAKMASTNSSIAYFPGESDNSVSDYEGGYTVFDIYANTAGRTKMDNLIRNGQPGLGETIPDTLNWGPFGQTSAPANWGDNVLSIGGQLNSTSQYVILTLAQSADVNQGANNALVDSFSAISFRKMNLNPPNVTDVTMTDPLRPGSVSGTYSGTVTFLFDSNVYIKTSQGLKPLTEVSPAELLNSQYVTVPSGGSVSASQITARGFSLSFTNLAAGSSITIAPERFCSANGGPATEPLRLTIVESGTNISLTASWGPDEENKDKLKEWTNLGVLTATPDSLEMTLVSRTSGITLGGSNPYYLTLDARGATPQSATIEALLTPQQANYIVSWSTESGTKNIVSISPTNTLEATITAVHAGTERINITATALGGNSVTKVIEVTVLGTMTIQKTDTGSAKITGSGRNYTVNLTVDQSNTGASSISLETVISPTGSTPTVNWAANPQGAFTLSPSGTGTTKTISAVNNASNGASGTITVSAAGIEDITITVIVTVVTRNQSGLNISTKPIPQ